MAQDVLSKICSVWFGCCQAELQNGQDDMPQGVSPLDLGLSSAYVDSLPDHVDNAYEREQKCIEEWEKKQLPVKQAVCKPVHKYSTVPARAPDEEEEDEECANEKASASRGESRSNANNASAGAGADAGAGTPDNPPGVVEQVKQAEPLDENSTLDNKMDAWRARREKKKDKKPAVGPKSGRPATHMHDGKSAPTESKAKFDSNYSAASCGSLRFTSRNMIHDAGDPALSEGLSRTANDKTDEVRHKDPSAYIEHEVPDTTARRAWS